MRHEVIIEIKKTTTLTGAKVTSETQRSEVIIEPDFDLSLEKAERSIELIDSNLVDGGNLQPEDFTDNVDERMKVGDYLTIKTMCTLMSMHT